MASPRTKHKSKSGSKSTPKALDPPNNAPILEAAAGTLNELKESEMSNAPESQILDVWASNLEEAMTLMEELIEEYPYIALVRCPHSNPLYPCTVMIDR